MYEGAPARTVLVVDDDHAQAHACARLLRLAGFDAVAAPDIESALVELTLRPIHAVLVDMQLRVERGADLIRRIRLEYPALTTILVSGSEPDEVVAEAARCGASGHLTKPFDLDSLVALIEAGFDK